LTEQKKSYDYINQSRGHKTKGNSYKDRYVETECPECGHGRAYKDTWKTRYAYTCLKRTCRHKWYIEIPQEEKDRLREEREEKSRMQEEKEQVGEQG
jgi:hypothetical protein